jgi:predicted DNA-binding transcriptional regulator AlpA
MTLISSVVVKVSKPLDSHHIAAMTEQSRITSGARVTLTAYGPRLEWSFGFPGESGVPALNMDPGYSASLIQRSLAAASEALDKEGVTDWTIDQTSLMSTDTFRDEIRSRLPVVGMAEVTDLLGVTRQRVHQYVEDGRFPERVAQLRSGPVWARQDVLEFANQMRGPGRPRRENESGATTTTA